MRQFTVYRVENEQSTAVFTGSATACSRIFKILQTTCFEYGKKYYELTLPESHVAVINGREYVYDSPQYN